MTLQRGFRLFFVGLIVWGLGEARGLAQTPAAGTYVSDRQSALWITGSSTVGPFNCIAGTIFGSATISIKPSTLDHPDTTRALDLSVTIPVRGFDCGKEAMNQDMYNAMKSDVHPEIRYALVSSELTARPRTPSSWYMVKTSGTLSIAGVEQAIEMTVRIKQLPDGKFRVVGSKNLSMPDFGITPPTALWGMIKADAQLTVHFDLITVEAPNLGSDPERRKHSQ